ALECTASDVVQPPRAAVERIIRRLKGVQTAAAPDTKGGSSGSLPQSGVSGPGRTTDRYDFLAPPQGPGEIGWLGPYRVLRGLGAGGMGVRFLAADPQLRRRVALKTMKPSRAARADARQRFLREARAAAAIKHDHVVTIYQVGEDRDVPYLAMQLLEGETL